MLSVILTACTPPPVAPIRIASNVWAGYEPLYLAQSLGWLASPKIKLIEFNSTTSILRAMRDHRLEGAAMTLDEALLLHEDDPDIRIVLVLDESNGADALIAQSGITTMNQLHGKRVAVETTALGAYVLRRALHQHQIRQDDVIVVHAPANEHLALFQTQAVDAIITFEPMKSKALHAGGNILFDSSQIPGEVMDVLVVHADVLSQHHARLQQLLQAWFDAVDYLDKHDKDASKRMQPRLKLAPSDILKLYRDIKLPNLNQNLAWFAPAGQSSHLYASMHRMAPVMQQQQFISDLPQPNILDDSLLYAINPGARP